MSTRWSPFAKGVVVVALLLAAVWLLGEFNALLRPRAAVKPLMAQLTIDESTAVGIAQPTVRASQVGFWQTGIAVFIFWNLFTLAGALLVSSIGTSLTRGGLQLNAGPGNGSQCRLSRCAAARAAPCRRSAITNRTDNMPGIHR